MRDALSFSPLFQLPLGARAREKNKTMCEPLTFHTRISFFLCEIVMRECIIVILIFPPGQTMRRISWQSVIIFLSFFSRIVSFEIMNGNQMLDSPTWKNLPLKKRRAYLIDSTLTNDENQTKILKLFVRLVNFILISIFHHLDRIHKMILIRFMFQHHLPHPMYNPILISQAILLNFYHHNTSITIEYYPINNNNNIMLIP